MTTRVRLLEFKATRILCEIQMHTKVISCTRNHAHPQSKKRKSRTTSLLAGCDVAVQPAARQKIECSPPFQVHPTEACADPRIEVFQGMAAVSHDLLKNRPRQTEIRRNPPKSAEDRRHH